LPNKKRKKRKKKKEIIRNPYYKGFGPFLFIFQKKENGVKMINIVEMKFKIGKIDV